MPALPALWPRVRARARKIRGGFVSTWAKPLFARKGTPEVWGKRSCLSRRSGLGRDIFRLYVRRMVPQREEIICS